MNQITKTIVWLAAFLGIGSIGLCTEPFAEGPYLGQTPPGSTAQVFAPGLICQAGPHQWEGNGNFSADGNTFCFQRVSGTFITENTDQGWTTPELIESIGEYSAWAPCLSPDANSIFFTIAETHPWIKHYDLFRCTRTARGWSKPQRLGPPLSSPAREFEFSIAANNNIYLCSGRLGGDRRKPTSDIWASSMWVVPFVDNTWTRAVNITLNHSRPCSPGIAPDESFMVIYSVKPGLPRGTETNLYLTLRRPDGTWTKPRDMGPKINSKYYEHGPRISPDKKYLFFNRCEGWDPRIYTGDICWVELKEYLPESYRAPEGMLNGHRDPMKRRSVVKQITGIGSAQALAEPIAKGPYLGQIPPGSTPQVFALGLICDTRPHQWESWPSFSADGNTFCFYRNWYVYITENTDQGWTAPQIVKSIPYKVCSPCLSPDANSIYFNYRYYPSKRWSLRRCMRTSKGWSLSQELGPPFSFAFGGFSVAADNSIYFNEPGSYWFAPFVGNTWPRAIKIPVGPIEGGYNGCHPGVAPDESFLVFYSKRPGAPGGTETDLYLTLRRADGTWTKLRNMGPRINTRYFEWGARISPDKKYMFFTRSTGWNLRPVSDTGDIYWVELKEYLPESYR